MSGLNVRLGGALVALLVCAVTAGARADYPTIDQSVVGVSPVDAAPVGCPVTLTAAATISPAQWHAGQSATVTYRFKWHVGNAIVDAIDDPQHVVLGQGAVAHLTSTRVITASTTGSVTLIVDGSDSLPLVSTKPGTFSVACLPTASAPSAMPRPSSSGVPAGSRLEPEFPLPSNVPRTFSTTPAGMQPSTPVAAEVCIPAEPAHYKYIAEQMGFSEASIGTLALSYRKFCSIDTGPSGAPDRSTMAYWSDPVGAVPQVQSLENCRNADMSQAYVIKGGGAPFEVILAPFGGVNGMVTLANANLEAAVARRSHYVCGLFKTRLAVYFR